MFSFLNPYVLIGGLVALIAVGGGGYLKGRSDCRAKYEYAAIQAERDGLITAMKAEKSAREADAQHMAENDRLLRDLQEKAEDDAKNLKDGDGVCFSPDESDSLRQHFRKTP